MTRDFLDARPRLGRFMQTDPISHAGGMNLYGYVGGDPVGRRDPSGLCGASLLSSIGTCYDGLQQVTVACDLTCQLLANGAVATEFLVRKLPLVDDDVTIRNIVTLVGDMNARGLYEVRQGTELWQALELAVSRMKDRVQKREAEDRLGQLAGSM